MKSPGSKPKPLTPKGRGKKTERRDKQTNAHEVFRLALSLPQTMLNRTEKNMRTTSQMQCALDVSVISGKPEVHPIISL